MKVLGILTILLTILTTTIVCRDKKKKAPNILKFADILQKSHLGLGSFQLYGFPLNVLYSHKSLDLYDFPPETGRSNRSNFITVWPEKDPVRARENPHIQVEVGQNMLNQVFTKQFVHLIVDRLAGYAIPVESVTSQRISLSQDSWFGKKVGGVQVEMKNIRVHRVRIGNFKSPDPKRVHMQEDYFGGRFQDRRQRNSLEKNIVDFVTDLRDKINRDLSNTAEKDRLNRRSPSSSQSSASGADQDSDDTSDNKGNGRRESPNVDNFQLNMNFPSTTSTTADQKPNQKNNFKGGSPQTTTVKTGNEKRLNMPIGYYRMSSDETRQILFFDKETMKVSIRGLNIVLTADYEIKGVDGWMAGRSFKGKTYVRALNSVLNFDIVPARDNTYGFPTLVIPELPVMYLGDVSMKFKESGHDKFLDAAVKQLSKKFSEMFPIMIATLMQENLPRITEILFDLADTQVIGLVDELMHKFSIQADTWPRMAIEDLHWYMKDYRLTMGLKLRHVKSRERHLLSEHRKLWQAMNPNAETGLKKEHKQSVLALDVKLDEQSKGIFTQKKHKNSGADGGDENDKSNTLEMYAMLLNKLKENRAAYFRDFVPANRPMPDDFIPRDAVTVVEEDDEGSNFAQSERLYRKNPGLSDFIVPQSQSQPSSGSQPSETHAKHSSGSEAEGGNNNKENKGYLSSAYDYLWSGTRN
jgi:hypothetical protein